jgi:hypothetical protein
MDPLPVTEPEIRACLKSTLQAADAARLIEEFPIEGGSARIDLTTLGQCFEGYEIKSDLDTFLRFSNQIHAYNRVFDTIHLVCGPMHRAQALLVVPSWWGVILAERDETSTVSLRVIRAASRNPRQESFSLASLLWRDEAAQVLASHQQPAPKKASSHLLWERIAAALPLERVREVVVEALLHRGDYRAAAVSTM